MADTHVRTAKELPRELLTAAKDADYVIHLGDFYSLELLKDLKKFGKFYGVIGNHDDLNLGSELREMEEIEITKIHHLIERALISMISFNYKSKENGLGSNI
jgi:putative phosphoesterase